MEKTDAIKKVYKKGMVVGSLATIMVLIIVAGLPFWWYSSGRDMQTFHDGLSTQFRTSLARILSVEGYDAKNRFMTNL
jgi:TolB-like protein